MPIQYQSAAARLWRAAACAGLALLCLHQLSAMGQTQQRPASRERPAQAKAAEPHRDHWQVPPLPTDNLLSNPWFRKTLDPWVGDGNWQGDSTKWGNPSPDATTGSAARISTGRRADSNVGKTVDVGEDGYLYQVVAADPANKTLKFDMYWVAHTLNPGEVNIYGGPAEKGPWTKVWRPFYQVHTKVIRPPGGRSANVLWRHYSDLTDLATTTLPLGHPYYKVEIHAKLPDKSGGFKITGLYFSATSDAEAAPLFSDRVVR